MARLSATRIDVLIGDVSFHLDMCRQVGVAAHR
jgi:hypothetical protein